MSYQYSETKITCTVRPTVGAVLTVDVCMAKICFVQSNFIIVVVVLC